MKGFSKQAAEAISRCRRKSARPSRLFSAGGAAAITSRLLKPL